MFSHILTMLLIVKYFKILQVLKGGDKFKFEHPNPFITEEEEGEVASVAYRYRKWDLGNDIVRITSITKT